MEEGTFITCILVMFVSLEYYFQLFFRSSMAAIEATDPFSSNLVPTQTECKSKRHSLRSSNSSCSTSHVDFKDESDTVDVNEKPREKHLTAKYPKHQMGLIRKRLAVEDWIDSELKKLFDIVCNIFLFILSSVYSFVCFFKVPIY